MAVVAQTATLQEVLGASSRTWIASAAVQDTAAGGSVNIVVTQNKTGATPPALPDTLTVALLMDDTQTVVRSFAVTPSDTNGATSTVSFAFTSDGVSGSAARAGTVKVKITAVNTSGAAAANYNINTDNNPADTRGTGNLETTGTRDKGWIRGTTTSTSAISNVALGGAKTQPAEYAESLFARTTLGAALYTARALTVAVSSASPALSGVTNSAASGNFDVSFASVVDNRFPAAVTAAATSVTIPVAALTGVADFTVTATNDTINVDPRLTASHHFQVDDNTFARSKNDTSKAMLSTSSGFLATRFTTARTAAGVNGLTANQTLTPVGPGTTVGPTASATANRDTADGWTDLLAWTSSKPGGTWNKTVAITAPAPIIGAAYVVGGADAYVLLAPDPRIGVMVGLGPTTASEDDHLHPGDTSTISVTVFNRDTGKRLTPDAATVTARLFRWNRTTARFEYLAADGVTWAAWTGTTVVADTHALTDAGDGVTFTRALGAVLGATTDLVAVQVTARVGGTPYGFYIGRELTGTPNGHAGYSVDPIGLALAGIISQR